MADCKLWTGLQGEKAFIFILLPFEVKFLWGDLSWRLAKISSWVFDWHTDIFTVNYNIWGLCSKSHAIKLSTMLLSVWLSAYFNLDWFAIFLSQQPQQLYVRNYLGPFSKFLSCKPSPHKTVVHVWILEGKTSAVFSLFFTALVSRMGYLQWRKLWQRRCLSLQLPIYSIHHISRMWRLWMWAQLDLGRWKDKPWSWNLQIQQWALIWKQSSEQVNLLGRNKRIMQRNKLKACVFLHQLHHENQEQSWKCLSGTAGCWQPSQCGRSLQQVPLPCANTGGWCWALALGQEDDLVAL